MTHATATTTQKLHRAALAVSPRQRYNGATYRIKPKTPLWNQHRAVADGVSEMFLSTRNYQKGTAFLRTLQAPPAVFNEFFTQRRVK